MRSADLTPEKPPEQVKKAQEDRREGVKKQPADKRR